jgi:HAMP domain-containing protein
MKLTNIADTISFKLSALYLLLFLCSFLSIGLTVYLLTSHTLEQQLKSTIETESIRLKTEYDSGGIAELKAEIDEVDGRASHTLFGYGVIDKNGKLLAGSLNNFQPVAGWQTVKRRLAANNSEKEGHELLYIKVMALPNKVWLGVGHDGQYIQNAVNAIIQAFIWGFVLVIFLGVAGGFYLSGAFLRKIENITQSAQAIIAGDLKHRLPVSKNRDELDNLA